MPQYLKNQFQRWTEEEPSVIESPMERGLREAANWLGLGELVDPVTTEMAPVAPLISHFKNPVVRKRATNFFVEQAARLMPQLREPAERFAKKYPRVAAHIDVDDFFRDLDADAQIYAPTPRQPLPGGAPGEWHGSRGRLAVDVDYADRVSKNQVPLNDVEHMLIHEGTHAAQGLGNKNFQELYEAADRLTGYKNNPFERSADSVADRSVLSKGSKTRTGYSAIAGLEQAVKDRPWHPAAVEIESILKKRRGQE